MGNSKGIPWFGLLACTAFALPNKLFLSQHEFSHFYVSSSFPQKGLGFEISKQSQDVWIAISKGYSSGHGQACCVRNSEVQGQEL